MRQSIALAALATVALALPQSQASPPTPAKRTTKDEYTNYAIAASNQLHSWYDTNNGLWQTRWWNSANAVTALAGFQSTVSDALNNMTDIVFPTTFDKAPSYYGYTNFINDYYDDELWWALAWIQVYDVTGDTKYLDMASGIFEDNKAAWGTTPCNGGLWWSKDRTYVNAISNELYLTTAAKLANRKPSSSEPCYYWNEAVRAHAWFLDSKLINDDDVVNDGLNDACQNNGIVPFTYNQGVILSGLTEMAWATGDNSYNDLANKLALAGIEHFTDSNGVLRESCEPNSCNGDSQQFKGIFARNIQFMVQRANSMPEENKEKYIKFLQTNADSIWANQENNQIGLVWVRAAWTAA